MLINIGMDSNYGTTMTASVRGTAGDETTPGEFVTNFMSEEAMRTVKAHICFKLEDKPHQLLSALTSLTVS